MKTFQPQPEFVNVQLRVSVLKQLLQGQKIHLSDIHSTSLEHKHCLQQLVLQLQVVLLLTLMIWQVQHRVVMEPETLIISPPEIILLP